MDIRFEKEPRSRLQHKKQPAEGATVEPRPPLGADGTASVPASTYRNTGLSGAGGDGSGLAGWSVDQRAEGSIGSSWYWGGLVAF